MRVAGALIPMAVMFLTAASASEQTSSSALPDLCSVLTKAEVQKATGQTTVMRTPNLPDTLKGNPVCTIDGGAFDIELILYSRTVTTPLTTPKDGQAVPGLGAGAYIRSTPGNVAVFAIKALTSKQALHVGLQSEESAEAMKRVAIEVAKTVLAKLP